MSKQEETAAEINRRIEEIAAIADPVLRELRFKQLSQEFPNIGIKILRDALAKCLDAREKNTDELLDLESGIDIDPLIPRDDVTAEMSEYLLGNQHYVYGDVLARVNATPVNVGKALKLIAKYQQLQGTFLGLCEFYIPDDRGRPIYYVLPENLANAFLHSHHMDKFPRIRVVTDIPLLDADFKPLQQGYNRAEQVYVIGASIAPATSISIIDELLQDFCFKAESDRTTYVGFLLTILIHHHEKLRARVPILNGVGNKSQVGKGELAQVLALTAEGFYPRTITIIPDDVELEKRMCSVLRGGGRTLVFDNAKPSKQMQIISSAVMERTVTDPVVSFRILGTSTDLHLDNTLQIIITHNGGSFSNDLLTRMASVRLHYDGNPTERTFKSADIRQFALKHRREIVGELLGMFKRWDELGRPVWTGKHRMQSWAEIIGGVLQANGLNGFLENTEAVAAQSDPYLESLTRLVATLVRGKTYRATELLSRAKTGGLFSAYLRDTKGGEPGSFGKILTQYIGRKITVGSEALLFHGRESKGSFEYSIHAEEKTGTGSPSPTHENVIPFNDLMGKREKVERNQPLHESEDINVETDYHDVGDGDPPIIPTNTGKEI